MSMQKIGACCPQKGHVKGYGRTWFCSCAWSDCLNVATLVLLPGFLSLFLRALWNATSLCCFSCAELWIQAHPQLSCQPALTIRTCLFPSAKELFIESREQQETSTWHLTSSWGSHMLRVKDFGLCCSSVRVHVQPQMDGALVFLHSSTWNLINGDGYYPFDSFTGKKEGSLMKIPIILGVCLLIVWMCMLNIHIISTLFTITSLFLHTSGFCGVLLTPQAFIPLNDKTKDLHCCCYCSFKCFSILYCLTPGHG